MNRDKMATDTIKGAALGALAYGVTPFGTIRFATDVVNAETVTIGGKVFEFDTAASPGSVVAGNVRVDVSGGATASDAKTALIAAINAAMDEVTASAGVGANSIRLEFSGGAASGGTLAVTEAMSAATNIVRSIANGVQSETGSYSMTPNATDVAEGSLVFDVTPPAGKTLIDASIVVVSISTGTVTKKAWDGGMTIVSNVLTITNAGSVDWAAGDVVSVSPVFA